MAFMDIFAAAVPNANKEKYLAHASSAADVFKEHGALAVTEAWGVDVGDGEITSFIKALQCGEDESVVCGSVTWPDKAMRDAAWPKIMEDQRMAGPMPFDGKRLIFGGFETLFEK